MHFQQSLIALIAAIGLAPTVLAAANIPDGGYTVENLEDGSSLWKSTTDSTLEPIKVEPDLTVSSTKFTKRRTDCWGNGLSHGGVDNALNGLRGWANTGTSFTSGNGPTSTGYVVDGVYAYYCITRSHTTGNLDIADVNRAIREMDAKCAPYTGSWFGWDGSSELVGKAATNQQVCTGPFN
jgi:hypothetical protein